MAFRVKAFAREKADALIGRDVLNQLILHADGPAQSFELTGP